MTDSTDPVPIRKTGQITDGAHQEQTPIRKTGQITDGELVTLDFLWTLTKKTGESRDFDRTRWVKDSVE